jgi:hypothetical protein
MLEAYAKEVLELVTAARKQPGDVVTLDFSRVRTLARKLMDLVS